MNKFTALCLISSLLSFTSPAFAEMGDDGPVSRTSQRSMAVQVEHESLLNQVSGLIGGDFRSTGAGSQLMPALGVRYYPAAHWNSVCMPSAYELGGSWSSVPSDFHQSTINYSGVSYQAHIQSMGEVHVAAVWQFWKGEHFIPELKLGVSVARFRDQETEVPPPFTPVDKTQIGISQITELGGTFPLNSRAGLNVGIGYERYSNHLDGSDNIGYDLTVSALTIRAMLEVKL